MDPAREKSSPRNTGGTWKKPVRDHAAGIG
jgi:hypothetical protein